jgi:hypothetical protein
VTDLETAIQLLTQVVEPGVCRFGMSRPFKGETCGEYLADRFVTNKSPGCDLCQANDFLEKQGYTRSKHGHWEKV